MTIGGDYYFSDFRNRDLNSTSNLAISNEYDA